MRRNRKSLVVCLLSMASVLLMTATPLSAAPEDDYDLAVGLYKKERWEGAADAFRAFLKANPQHAQAATARLYLGLALVNADDDAAAREALREFVRLHPDNRNLPDALYRIGEASYSLGEYQQAEKDLIAFLERYGDHELGEWALPYLADAELRLEKPRQAADHFRESLDRFPKGALAAESTFGLARSLEALDQQDEALELYRTLADGNSPRAAPALLRIATVRYDAGDFPAAARDFETLITRFPKHSLVNAAHLNAGFAYYRANEFAKAVEHLEAAVADEKQAPVARHWVGMARKSLGDVEGAIAAFRSVVEGHRESPIATESQFQWADVALRSGNYADAVTLFEQVAARDPQSTQASDAIHFAGEAALLAGDFDKAEALVARFTKDYGRTAYRMQNQLLAGRIAEERAAALPAEDAEKRDTLEREALATYSAVLDGTTVDSTRMKARFAAARLREKRNEPAEALDAIEPVLDAIVAEGSGSPYLGALVIAARARLATGNADAAIAAAANYLELAPKGDQADAALAARSIARFASGDMTGANADLQELQGSFPKSRVVISTTRDLAERAYDNENWAAAAEYFERLTDVAEGTPDEAVGLSGLGWSRHKAGQFTEAAAAFDQLLERVPDAATLAPEAAYMKGKALQDGGDLTAAAEAYRVGFERFAPVEPAATGEESSGALRNAYLSGLQRARVLRLQDKVAESDAAYAALTAKFPKPQRLDELLDEWALLHYEAGDFPKADALFQRILEETPDSPAAANARLSLAESALFAGDSDAARTAFTELAEDDTAPPAVRQRAQSLLVSLSAESGDWTTVESLARAFVAQHPESRERPIVLYQLGESLLHLNQADRAVEMLTQVAAIEDDSVRSEPWFPRVSILLAEAAFQKKEYDKAIENLNVVRAIEPPPKFVYLADELHGRILKNQAKFDEARTAFQRVLDDPNAHRTATAARAQYEIAQTWYLQENWTEARTAALKVYTLYKFPEWQAPALYMVALADEALGESEKATATFRDVMTEFPGTEYARQAGERLGQPASPNG